MYINIHIYRHSATPKETEQTNQNNKNVHKQRRNNNNNKAEMKKTELRNFFLSKSAKHEKHTDAHVQQKSTQWNSNKNSKTKTNTQKKT